MGARQRTEVVVDVCDSPRASAPKRWWICAMSARHCAQLCPNGDEYFAMSARQRTEAVVDVCDSPRVSAPKRW